MSTPILPNEISLEVRGSKIKLKREISKEKLSGVSEKAIYRDVNGKIYFVKLQKFRIIEDIFDPSSSPRIQKIKESLKKGEKLSFNDKILLENYQKQLVDFKKDYQKHMRELRDTHSLLEVLSPRIAKGIFGEQLMIPDNYFYVEMPKKTRSDSETRGEKKESEECGTATMVLSKGISEFDEFLSKKVEVLYRDNPKSKPSDWNAKELPRREQLKITKDEAEILGKLLAVGLLMGHWDIFNNINLSNSGLVKVDNKAVPVIVDWGNSMGVGFGGLSAEESAFKNLDLTSRAGKVDYQNLSITDFQHAVPFDEVVYPLLPRQLVKDLFNLSGKDEISKAMLKGFKDACEVAEKSVKTLDKLLPEIVQSTLRDFTDKVSSGYAAELLNPEIFPKTERELESVSGKYNLLEVMKGRIKSLVKMREELENGKTLEEIAEQRLKQIFQSQTLKSDLKETKAKSEHEFTPQYQGKSAKKSVKKTQFPLSPISSNSNNENLEP